jgi:hypothetical protein
MRAASASNSLSYWCAGGTILSHGQPLGRTDGTAIARARELICFYRREGLACARRHDPEGARYCATLAEELRFAVKGAEKWIRATTTYARAA